MQANITNVYSQTQYVTVNACWCLLFVACCFLPVVSCLLFVACCLLHVVCCLLLVAFVCCILFFVCFLLSVVCCLLFVACYLLFATCFAYCLLSVMLLEKVQQVKLCQSCQLKEGYKINICYNSLTLILQKVDTITLPSDTSC